MRRPPHSGAPESHHSQLQKAIVNAELTSESWFRTAQHLGGPSMSSLRLTLWGQDSISPGAGRGAGERSWVSPADLRSGRGGGAPGRDPLSALKAERASRPGGGTGGARRSAWAEPIRSRPAPACPRLPGPAPRAPLSDSCQGSPALSVLLVGSPRSPPAAATP